MRRRKQKYTWFPILGTILDGTAGEVHKNFIILQASPTPDSTTQPTEGQDLNVVALVPDYTLEFGGSDLSISLNDYVQGNDWFLKRLVGKIHVSWTAPTVEEEGTAWPQCLVTVGFMVARSQDTAENTIDLQAPEYDPQNVDNIRQPWLWRRTWLLGNPNTGDYPVLGGGLPANNYVGSVAEGSHIDSKVSRRILKEQRLWAVMSVMGISEAGLEVTGNGGDQGHVTAIMDLRILGAMRRSKNRSAF